MHCRGTAARPKADVVAQATRELEDLWRKANWQNAKISIDMKGADALDKIASSIMIAQV